MSAGKVELIGGPMDGCRYVWPDDNPTIVIATPRFGALFMPDGIEAASVDVNEHAYWRDPMLPWRFIYGGERAR